MMLTIEADSLPLDGPIFTTPEAAIDFAKDRHNRTHNNDDITKYVGRRIASVDWGDGGIKFHLDDWTILEFRIVGENIDLRALSVNTEASQLDDSMQDVIFIRLADQNFLWKRGALLRAVFGKRFEGIHFSGVRSCFLYVESVGILRLSILVTRQERRPFLFWCPSD